MASYDVESVRMQRLAASLSGLDRFAMGLEARRAARFERENLAVCDGIIAVSGLDKEIFVRDYHFDPERVLRDRERCRSSLFCIYGRDSCWTIRKSYMSAVSATSQTSQAALRLVRDIMPLVRKRYPKACVWIVGQGAGRI